MGDITRGAVEKSVTVLPVLRKRCDAFSISLGPQHSSSKRHWNQRLHDKRHGESARQEGKRRVKSRTVKLVQQETWTRKEGVATELRNCLSGAVVKSCQHHVTHTDQKTSKSWFRRTGHEVSQGTFSNGNPSGLGSFGWSATQSCKSGRIVHLER